MMKPDCWCESCGEHYSKEVTDRLQIEVERLKKYAAPVDAKASVPRLKPCTHNEYWTTNYGHCMACRAEDAELQISDLKAAIKKLIHPERDTCDHDDPCSYHETELMKELKRLSE